MLYHLFNDEMDSHTLNYVFISDEANISDM